jgi:hypothetical protein
VGKAVVGEEKSEAVVYVPFMVAAERPITAMVAVALITVVVTVVAV